MNEELYFVREILLVELKLLFLRCDYSPLLQRDSVKLHCWCVIETIQYGIYLYFLFCEKTILYATSIVIWAIPKQLRDPNFHPQNNLLAMVKVCCVRSS
jgi:hypothetical protein